MNRKEEKDTVNSIATEAKKREKERGETSPLLIIL